MSICPQVMPKGLPSSDSDLVSPVIACLVAVYGALLGLGTWAEIDPLLMIRPPDGILRLHQAERVPGTQEGAGEVHVHDTLPILDVELVDGYRRRDRARIVEQQIETAVLGSHLVEEGRDRSGLAHIGGDGRTRPAHTPALLDGFGQQMCSSSHGHDVPAVAGQGQRRGPPQSGAGSGHHRDLVVLHRRILAA